MGPAADSLHWSAAAVLGLLVALAAVPVARSLGRGALTDAEQLDPDGRAMPRSGGLGVFVAWAIALLATTEDAAPTVQLLALAGFAGVVGLHDDLTSSSPRWRLAVLGALALNAPALGLRAEAVVLPGGGVWTLGLLSVPLSAAWILGTTVAFDVIDGLDGLASSLAAVACIGIAVLAPAEAASLAAGGLGGACAAFFLLNRPPATITLGNNGSNLVGFAIGMLSISALGGDGVGMPLLPALLLIAIPVTDAAIAVTRRLADGTDVFTPDRGHVHHRLESRYGSTRALTLLLMTGAVAAIAGGLGKGVLGLLVIGAMLYEITSPEQPASR